MAGMMDPKAWKRAGLILLATAAAVGVHRLVLKSLEKEVVLYRGPDGKEGSVLRTSQRDVAGFLREQGIRLGDFDVVAPSADSPVTEGMEIDVGLADRSVQVEKRRQTAPVEIEYTDTLNAGEIIDVQKGQDGLLEVETETYSLNGREAFERVLRMKTLTPAKKAVVVEGTGLRSKLYTLERRARVRKVVTMEATAYYPGPEDTGQYADGKTANNRKAGYGVAAVDPKFMRLGTRLYVEGYGYAEAHDVGGAIKGKRIDLCFDGYDEAVRWGRKKVKVYILN